MKFSIIDSAEAAYAIQAVSMFPLAPFHTAMKQFSRWTAARAYVNRMEDLEAASGFLAGVGDAEIGEKFDEMSECNICNDYFDYDKMEDTKIGLVCRECFEDNSDNPGLCGNCNGSGEGMYEGSRCNVCGGSGEEESIAFRDDPNED